MIPVTVGEYPNTDIKNFMHSEIVYRSNSNNMVKTLILLQNNTNTLKKFILTNDFIYLKKLLVIYFTSILISYFKSIYVMLTFFLFALIWSKSLEKRFNIVSLAIPVSF